MNEERLQKILSKSGYGSRRDCEKIIAEGRVSVNNQISKLGDKADIDSDVIRVDNKILAPPETKQIYLAFYLS